MFQFTTHKKSPYIWASLSGKLISIDDADQLFNEINHQLSKTNHSLILNLKEVDYMNSSGFNTFIKLLTITRNNGGDTILCNINESINQLLLTTKLNTIFKIENNINNIDEINI